MAYLQPRLLTCPSCGFSAEVKWVVAVGPNSKPGQTPTRRLHQAAPYKRDPEDKNVLICPECEAHAT